MGVLTDRSRIGRYIPIAVLGEGGMGRVYLTFAEGQKGFRKLLVVKELKAECATNPEYVSMFEDEARLAARLNHPNVVQTYEVGEDTGRHFMAMEYLDGQSLHVLISRLGREAIPLAMHVRILADTAAALHYAHELRDFNGKPINVVHRDVSPHNVFLTYDGAVKLMDFGIAKTVSGAQTASGVMKGKVAYMAPEQALGDRVDRRADIFAIGVMLWEALTGQRISGGAPLAQVLQLRCTGLEPRVTDIKPDAIPALVKVCERAMATSPDDRYATAAQMQEALEAYLETTARAPGSREIGTLLRTTFSEDRSKLEARIEQLTAELDSEMLRADVPLPDLSNYVSREEPSGGATAKATADASVLPVAPRRSGGAMQTIVVVAAILAVGGVVSVVAARRSQPAMTANPAPVASRAISAPGTPSSGGAPVGSASSTVEGATNGEGAMIGIVVSASPDNATITLDGTELESNPYRGRVPHDGRQHQLHIAADGYAPLDRTVTFDQDVSAAIALHKIDPSRPGAWRATPSIPHATASGGHLFAPAPATTKPKHDIDDQDPYQK